MVAAEDGQRLLLLLLVLLPVGEDLGQQGVKVGVWAEGAAGHKLLSACRALLVP